MCPGDRRGIKDQRSKEEENRGRERREDRKSEEDKSGEERRRKEERRGQRRTGEVKGGADCGVEEERDVEAGLSGMLLLPEETSGVVASAMQREAPVRQDMQFYYVVSTHVCVCVCVCMGDCALCFVSLC